MWKASVGISSGINSISTCSNENEDDWMNKLLGSMKLSEFYL